MTSENQGGEGSIEQKVEKVESLIASARRLLAEGKIVDLAALQGHVGELCAGIAEHPDDKDGTLGKTLQGIIGALDVLAQDLASQNRTLGSSVIGASMKEAADAYKKPNGKR